MNTTSKFKHESDRGHYQLFPSKVRLARLATAAAVSALALSACYVIPVDQQGNPVYAVGVPSVTPSGAPVVVQSGPHMAQLNVRLYPANDFASQTGVLTGSVTNMMNGKGRFQFNYRGELLAGEAPRVSGAERKGIASAYGPRGTYARCEYQMTSAYQGAGLCTFSNGAEYEVHIGG